MRIFNIFSKRQKALRGDVPDVYCYDRLPPRLRHQILHIITDALGTREQYEMANPLGHSYPHIRAVYDFIADTLCREHGFPKLPVEYPGHKSKMLDLLNFFLQVENFEQAIDVVEIAFRLISSRDRELEYLNRDTALLGMNCAIEELNYRFKENGVGYSFSDGSIVRIDSEFIHSEVVRPALGILNRKQYFGARQEFLNAHEHYRKGNTKEALNDCLKSFESVMKSICDARKWPYNKRATASTLIQICLNNNLVPSFWQSQFGTLRSLLESGVPTARNRLSGHGQGAEPTVVPDHVAGYVLHLTAAAIVFLAEAEASESLPQSRWKGFGCRT